MLANGGAHKVGTRIVEPQENENAEQEHTVFGEADCAHQTQWNGYIANAEKRLL